MILANKKILNWGGISITLGFILSFLPLNISLATGDNLRDQAFESLWHEHADQAVDLFQSYLAANPGQRDPATLHGLALALSWNSQQDEALKIYSELITANATDGEALIGKARAQIWANRLAEGWRSLRTIENQTDFTPQARQAAGEFALKVLNEYTPRAEVSWHATWDSDNLNVQRISTLYATTMGHGVLVQTGPQTSFYTQTAQPGVTALRWQVLVTTGLAPRLTIHGLGWFDHFGSKKPLFSGVDKLNWSRPGGDAWLTWQASSRLRFDGGAASQAIDTYLGFAQKIGYTQESLSGDWILIPRLTLSAAGLHARYSDSNRKLLGRLTAGWHGEGTVEIDLRASFTHMDFTRPYPGGYWSPDWVRNGSLQAKAKVQGKRITLTCETSLGREKEANSRTITVGGGSLRLGYRITSDWFVAVSGGHSRSSFSTASGYRRTFLGLTIKGNF